MLEWLGRQREAVGFNRINKAMGLNPATTARLLRTLAGRGYVRRGEAGDYQLAPAAAGFGRAAITPPQLAQLAEPVVDELCGQTENSALALHWSGRHVQCVAKTVHPDAPAMQPVGRLSDRLDAAPWGWLALAEMPREQRQRWRKKNGVKQRDLEAWVREAHRVETEGFVLDHGQFRPHLRRLASPLRDADGRLVGMLAIGGLEQSLPDDSIPTVGGELADHAWTLSVNLGWQDASDQLSGSNE